MMCYKKKNTLMGFLNDYDLSSLSSAAGPEGNERMGAVPFMALDLLTPKGQRGEVKCLYRHALESFMWVLVWVSLRYRNGVLLPPETRLCDSWANTDLHACAVEKYYFLCHCFEFDPDGIDPLMWKLVLHCLFVLDTEAHNRQLKNVRRFRARRAGEETNAEESELDVDDFLHKFTSTKSWVQLSDSLR
ncbi:hypothetical protein DFH29DRAFT_854729 [Suillus ampliporus]|nr:hypothetical protein DFH29DRAFT_854729 [Suillus ampliporus]